MNEKDLLTTGINVSDMSPFFTDKIAGQRL
jgi:hypothetical protein